MRLLYRADGGQLALTDEFISNIPRYAILSHTWGAEEVLFKDIANGTATQKETGFRKLEFCLDQAAADGLKYCWVDSCCIDKQNSSELSRAINSMFRWYQNAARCYAYLTDVSTERGMEQHWESYFQESRWFTRGWTLQELIAPRTVEFFSVEGKKLGDRKSLEQNIRGITGIPVAALRGKPLSDFSRRERMLWAHRRITTVEEDGAYCLLGLFEVHMPLIYGEGSKGAFIRLQETIDKRQAHEDGSGPTTNSKTVTEQTYQRHEEVEKDVRMEDIVRVLRCIIPLFDRFAAPKQHGHEAAMIVTKLDLEKFILLEWSENVKIFEVHRDQRLQSQETRRFVNEILDRILHLLSDSFELEDQHGLKDEKTWIEDLKKSLAAERNATLNPEEKRHDAQSVTSEEVPSRLFTSHDEVPPMSDPCLERLGLHLQRPCENGHGIRAHWVIVSVAKFEVLIDKLASLLTRLRKHFPLNPVLRSSVDLEAVKTSHLEIIVEAAKEHREKIADSTKHILRERKTRQQILDTLWFRTIDQRRDSISQAHERTFQWALEKTNYERPWDDICQWLQEGTGIYWISGKAGSGKSTLMKYIYSSESTKHYLSQWAGSNTCIMANFFFWYLGTSEQNTQQGLARGLLYQVLSAQPELISKALPAMWKETWDGRTTAVLPSYS